VELRVLRNPQSWPEPWPFTGVAEIRRKYRYSFEVAVYSLRLDEVSKQSRRRYGISRTFGAGRRPERR